jgi:hypothetical protein
MLIWPDTALDCLASFQPKEKKNTRLVVALFLMSYSRPPKRIKMQTIEEVWEAVGRKSNAAVGCEWTLSLTSQAGSYQKLSFQMMLGNISVVGIGKYEATAGGQITFTAPINSPDDLYIGVYPWSYSDIFAKVLRAQDIIVGEESFDRAFVVKSNYEEWAKFWLAPSVRSAMMDVANTTMIIKDKKISMRFSFSLSDDLPKQVTQLLTALQAIHEQGTAPTNAWSYFAHQMNGEFFGVNGALWTGARIIFDLRAVPIMIELIQKKERSFGEPEFYTQISGRKQRSTSTSPEAQTGRTPQETKARPQEINNQRLPQYKITAEAPQKLAALLREHEDTLAALKPVTFMSEGEIVSMTLRGAILSSETLQKAASIVADFCPITTSAGPYR